MSTEESGPIIPHIHEVIAPGVQRCKDCYAEGQMSILEEKSKLDMAYDRLQEENRALSEKLVMLNDLFLVCWESAIIIYK